MTTKQEDALQGEQQSRNIEQRRALNDAYAALLGQQTVQTFSAFTFEEALDLQIEKIEGAGTELRPNLLKRVDGVEQKVLQAVEQLKQVPPELFVEQDEEQDVNTSQE